MLEEGGIKTSLFVYPRDERSSEIPFRRTDWSWKSRKVFARRQKSMLYKSLLRPLLFRKDPEESHEMILALLAKTESLSGILEAIYNVNDPRLHVKVGPLAFPNPVGLAGGFDKNAVAPRTIASFGFGFMEIGAITAQAQPGNPKPRLYRLPEDDALINRLGFNNEGAAAIAAKLERMRASGGLPKIPLGMNIGRTKIVETKDAVADFLECFEELYPHGDFFTLNVSSPNTPNLRDLQEKNLLRDLLSAVQEKNRDLATRAREKPKPIFVKIAPDMEFSQVDEIIEVVEAAQLTGIVATNATAFMRENLKSPNGSEPGGLSGRPITAKVTSFVSHIYKETRGQSAHHRSRRYFQRRRRLRKNQSRRERGADIYRLDL